MAADSVLRLTSVPVRAAAASSSTVSAAGLGPANPPSASGSGADDAKSAAPQSARSSGDGASSSGSGAAGSAAGASKAAGKAGAKGSGDSQGTAGKGKRSARSSGASASRPTRGGSQSTTQTAAAGTDFSAALAQSLAAAPADDTATPGAAADGTTANSNAVESDDSTSNAHAKTDPVSNALMLLEQALAGALAGLQAGAAAASAAGAAAASTGTSTASSADTGPIGSPGNGAAATLDALLTQNLSSDPNAGGANAAAATGTGAATPAATASTAAAALTAAAQLSSASHLGPQQGTASSRLTLASPVGTSAWTDELGTKLTWLANQGIQSASLQLSPEHLGPLQVNISVHDGRASVWFGAAQPDTRTALQQSLPQLRQLFANQGLTLADAGVSREPPRGQGRQSSARSAAPVSAMSAVSLESADAQTTVLGGLGLLDTYA